VQFPYSPRMLSADSSPRPPSSDGNKKSDLPWNVEGLAELD
jgi:hypothetical protein